MNRRHTLLSLAASLGLSACGFQLRGSGSFKAAFSSLFSGFAPNSALGQEFKRTAIGWGMTVLDKPEQANTAQVVLRINNEQREKVVVGAGVAGQVREFQLRQRLNFSLFTTQGKSLLEDVELLQQRDFSYNESAALAKEAEEQLLYRDMQTEVVLQLIRRLTAVKAL